METKGCNPESWKYLADGSQQMAYLKHYISFPKCIENYLRHYNKVLNTAQMLSYLRTVFPSKWWPTVQGFSIGLLFSASLGFINPAIYFSCEKAPHCGRNMHRSNKNKGCWEKKALPKIYSAITLISFSWKYCQAKTLVLLFSKRIDLS